MTTTTGREAAARAATKGSSSPPVASSTRAALLHLGHQRRDPGRVVGDLAPVSPRTDGHIHLGLGHIDPYVDTVLSMRTSLRTVGPSLRDAGLVAQATVRAPDKGAATQACMTQGGPVCRTPHTFKRENYPPPSQDTRAATRCSTAAEESCTTGTMGKNQIGSRAGSGQERGSAAPE